MHGLMDLLGVAQEEEQDERSKPPSQLGAGGAGGECGESHGKRMVSAMTVNGNIG